MAIDAPIHISSYDPAWPRLFEVERELLGRVLAPWLVGPIEHIGSTAVPGLVAKPVIDIMGGVESLAASHPAIAAVRQLDYHYAPYRADVIHWFCKPGPALRTHHLHLVPFRSRFWHERLEFRDCLRSDQTVAQAYAELKLRLAADHETDREAYTEGKGPFVSGILRGLSDKIPRNGNETA